MTKGRFGDLPGSLSIVHHFPDIIMLLIISAIAIIQVMAQPGTDYAKNDGYCFMCVTEFYPYDYTSYFTELSEEAISTQYDTTALPYFCTLDFKCRDYKLENYNCERGIKTCLLYSNFSDALPDMVVDDA